MPLNLKIIEMKNNNLIAILILSVIWITTQSVNCRRPIPYQNCGTYKQDSIFYKTDVINQTATFTLADTIKVFSRVSDTITPAMSSAFIYNLSNLGTVVQAYKVVPVGSSYQLNFANIEFNLNVQIGSLQAYQGLGYNLIYKRSLPINELQFSLKPGVVGLYAIVLNRSYNDYGSYFRNPNDDCVTYANTNYFAPAKQNLQYWNTLGLTTLSLASSNGSTSLNKNDRNYFFVKIIP
jgi:hypothetical protein